MSTVPYRTLPYGTLSHTEHTLFVKIGLSFWSQSDLLGNFIFTNISDQAKNIEMNVVGRWEFELEKRELAKIANAKGRLPF